MDADTRELKAAAFETLMFYPGSDMQQWMSILLREYTEEVVAVLGSDPDDVVGELSRWWHEMEYEDENTGINKKYSQWAKLLANHDAVAYYRTLVEEANKARGIK